MNPRIISVRGSNRSTYISVQRTLLHRISPKKFRGSKPLKANATRGEALAGDSIEGVMIGGGSVTGNPISFHRDPNDYLGCWC
ncbi:hypothetical protein CY34DRAFT_802988, partial [Suillus luteus UH-Slu-Lm8-n1]